MVLYLGQTRTRTDRMVPIPQIVPRRNQKSSQMVRTPHSCKSNIRPCGVLERAWFYTRTELSTRKKSHWAYTIVWWKQPKESTLSCASKNPEINTPFRHWKLPADCIEYTNPVLTFNRLFFPNWPPLWQGQPLISPAALSSSINYISAPGGEG